MDAPLPGSARTLARLLAGAWRAAPGPVELTAAELARVAPLLWVHGAGSLAWARIARGPLAGEPAAQLLKDAARAHAVQGARLEQRMCEAVAALAAHGIEALVAKGWAIARAYAEPAARSSADVDLYVRPSDEAAAARVLAGDEAIDLHAGCPDLPDRSFEELAARALPVPCGGTTVRVLAPADHLRLVVVHMLRHAVWRAIWLCDVAALAEAHPEALADRAGDPVISGWVASAVGLAQALVGAAGAAAPVPEWLIADVLERWERPGERHYDGKPLAAYLVAPGGLGRALRGRWPTRLEASYARHAPLDGSPRWPLQLQDVLMRGGAAVMRLPADVLRAVRDLSRK